MYELATASQLPAGSRWVAGVSCSTTPASAAPSVHQMPGPVQGDRLLAPMYPRGCAHQPPPPRSILCCIPKERGLALLEAGSSLPALPASRRWWGDRRGGRAAFKKAQLGAEPRPSGERGRQQNTALGRGEPSFFLLLSSLFIAMSWRSSWRARGRPTRASSS